jgi:lipoprotein-anchoring transpeptidase ErfK/SrfK
MPHSIFFSGGYAIHATPHTGNLGRPASHGCIRLHPNNAAILYNMTKGEPTIITIKD